MGSTCGCRARRGNGHEEPMHRSWQRLCTRLEAGLGEEPAPVLRRVLVVNGKEPEASAPAFSGTLAQDLAAPRQISSERLADPVVEEEETARSEHALYLREHGQRLVDHVH